MSPTHGLLPRSTFIVWSQYGPTDRPNMMSIGKDFPLSVSNSLVILGKLSICPASPALTPLLHVDRAHTIVGPSSITNEE
ncbi:Hypothetical predicted protein, partial [Pelobates cultripes]